MAGRFTLDPVSGIPDPPDDESKILDWAKELTKSLQRDHVESVDRIETQMMMDSGVLTRPDPVGSRRFYFDVSDDTLWLDVEQADDFSEWIAINKTVSYQSDGRGVNVIFSTSLPFTTPGTSGYFSFDEEIWDEDSYWSIGTPTEVEIPESRTYQVTLTAVITDITATGEIFIYTETNGTLATSPTEFQHTLSTGTGVEYDIKISYIKDLVVDDILKIFWGGTETFDINSCSLIVTPLTTSTGDIGPTLSDHGELAGLSDDDHLLYLLASDATDRSTFATNWTDLTDAGETALHTHSMSPLYMENNEYIYWRTNAGGDNWHAAIKVDDSDDFYFGIYGGTNDTYIRGQDIDISGSSSVAIGAGTGFDVTVADNIDLNAPGGYIYLNSWPRITANNRYLQGRVSGSADYYHLVGMDDGNRVAVGSESRNTWVMSDTILRLGRYESSINLEDDSPTYVDVLGFEVFDHDGSGTTATLGVGNSARGLRIMSTNTTVEGKVRVDCLSDAGVPTQARTDLSSGQWCVYQNTNASPNEFWICAYDGVNFRTHQII